MFYKRISDLHPLGKPKKLSDEELDWNQIEPIMIPESASDQDNLEDEYYAKSLWFEVDVAKDANNAPATAISNIVKYQSKRMNAYLMMTKFDELSASVISATHVNAHIATCDTLSTQLITTSSINSENLNSENATISSLSATSISAADLSANLGIIDQLSGTSLKYVDGHFDNITVTGVADLSAEAAYWADIAELYIADDDYVAGTLLKFGGENEVTIANDKVNAVVSERPAILMNNQDMNKKHAVPLVLTGRSNVRVIHPINKFDKIYLSEIPGVGSAESYRISTSTIPIGIALEDKPENEEGLVECILQLNFD